MRIMKTTNPYEQLITTVPKRMYWDQCSNSRIRGHEQPAYTRDELVAWVTNQPHFQKLYDAWAASDYDSDLRPSCDRLDNSKGYSFDNIELVTWLENKQRANEDVKAGILADTHKPVHQYTLDGIFVASYISQGEAERITGANQQNISACCRGLLNHTNRFQWFFDLQDHVKPIEANNDYSVPIYCYNSATGDLVDIYPSIDFVVDDNFDVGKVRSVVRGEYKSHNEHYFSFEHLSPDNIPTCTYLPTSIEQYTRDGELLAAYPSMNEAARQTGLRAGNISKCCNGIAKSAGGFIWKRP